MENLKTVRDVTPWMLRDLGYSEDPLAPNWFIKVNVRIILRNEIAGGAIHVYVYDRPFGVGETPQPVWDVQFSGTTPMPILAAVMVGL